MPHPCDRDLDSLDDFLEEVEYDGEAPERWLRALRSLRASYESHLLAEAEEVESSPLDDFEAAWDRLKQHLSDPNPRPIGG